MTTRTDFEKGFAETGRHIDEMIADTRENFREERQELRNKWDKLEMRRTEIVDEGDDKWEEVKVEFEEGWRDIKDSYEDLKHKLSDNHEGHNH
jgi:hypothetical protein